MVKNIHTAHSHLHKKADFYLFLKIYFYKYNMNNFKIIFNYLGCAEHSIVLTFSDIARRSSVGKYPPT